VRQNPPSPPLCTGNSTPHQDHRMQAHSLSEWNVHRTCREPLLLYQLEKEGTRNIEMGKQEIEEDEARGEGLIPWEKMGNKRRLFVW